MTRLNSNSNNIKEVQVRYLSGELAYFKTPLEALKAVSSGNNPQKISFRIGETDFRWVAVYDENDRISSWINQPMSFIMNFFRNNRDKVTRGEITEEEADELDDYPPYVEILSRNEFFIRCVTYSRHF